MGIHKIITVNDPDYGWIGMRYDSPGTISIAKTEGELMLTICDKYISNFLGESEEEKIRKEFISDKNRKKQIEFELGFDFRYHRKEIIYSYGKGIT